MEQSASDPIMLFSKNESLFVAAADLLSDALFTLSTLEVNDSYYDCNFTISYFCLAKVSA
jgi:hypothetical protein